MASELVTSSQGSQLSMFVNDASNVQIPRGVDVPLAIKCSSYAKPSSSYAWKSEYAFGSFTPPSFWSDASLSPGVGSSTCSTETESNEEDDDDFMAGLAEQMAHFMLDNDEEETHTLEKAFNSCSSNSSDSHWRTGGFGSHSSPTKTLAHLPAPSLLNQERWKADTLELLHCLEAGKADTQGLYFARENLSHPALKKLHEVPSLGTKVEELLQKQEKKSTLCNPCSPTDSSVERSVGGGLHALREPNPKPSNGVKSQHCKPSDIGLNIQQCQHPRHKPSYSRVQRTKPQYCAASGHRQTQMQNCWNTDQQGTRMLNPTTFLWNAAPNTRRGSNMRAMFLNSNHFGKGSVGTGVFLPHCPGNNSDIKWKPDYPVHFSEATPDSSTTNFGAAIGNSKYFSRSHRGYEPSHTSSHFPQSLEELNLPVEWTY